MLKMGSAASSMTLEEKIKAYKELRRKIEELEEKKKVLVAEILDLIPKESKILHVAEYLVKRITRLSIRISLENAKLFGAVKMEEIIDKEKIKKLFALGHSLPDVSEIEFIQVSSPYKSRKDAKEEPYLPHQ